MTPSTAALIGVALGGFIGWIGIWYQIKWDAKRRQIERRIGVYKEAIDGLCQLLGVESQEHVLDQEALREWEQRYHEAYLAHWKGIGYLRLEGDGGLADRIVELHDYIKERGGRDYLRNPEGWDDAINRGFGIFGAMADRVRDLENAWPSWRVLVRLKKRIRRSS